VAEGGARDPWYENWFGEEYLAVYAERNDEEAARQADFARRLLAPFANRGRMRFLDLACGTGRHAVALDPESGRVAGLDLSLRLLLAARRRGERTARGYARGDMRRLPFRSGSFGAVVNFFTSFGYFDDEADDARVVAALAALEEKTVDGVRIRIRRRYDPAARRVEKEIEMGEGERRRVFHERVRAFGEGDLRALHAAAGLSVVEAFGDFDGTPFDARHSPRLILLGVKDGAARAA